MHGRTHPHCWIWIVNGDAITVGWYAGDKEEGMSVVGRWWKRGLNGWRVIFLDVYLFFQDG